MALKVHFFREKNLDPSSQNDMPSENPREKTARYSWDKKFSAKSKLKHTVHVKLIYMYISDILFILINV